MNYFAGRTRMKILATFIVATPLVLLNKQALDVYRKVAPVPPRRITTYDGAPDALMNSPAARLANPRRHVSTDDSLFMDVELPPKARGLSDEALLAAFVRGFFGGKVFAIERGFLSLFRPGFAYARFSAIDEATLPPPVWEPRLLEGDVLPPMHTRLFGAFQVVGKDLDAAATASSIDVAFGSDMHMFAGVHRFTVHRGVDPGRPDVVRVECAHTTCNPAENKPLRPQWMFAFHKAYSMLLFRESMGEVLRRIGD